MGIITLALITHGALPAGGTTPGWVIVSCALVMGLGTAMGGWRIMRTLGRGITDLGPCQGFSSDLTSSSVILVSSHFGFPLSTTQVVTGAVLGTGVGTRVAGRTAPLRWAVAGRMVSAWLITLPSAGLVGAAAWLLSNLIGGAPGSVTIVVIAMVAAAVIWWLSRRDRVGADNVTAEWTGSLVPAGHPTASAAVPAADLVPAAPLAPTMVPAVEIAAPGSLAAGSDSRPVVV
jgi:PiT family inorganic phosphate transporter